MYVVLHKVEKVHYQGVLAISELFCWHPFLTSATQNGDAVVTLHELMITLPRIKMDPALRIAPEIIH